MLNSIAEYMDEENEDVEGKPLLEMILRVQENASLMKKDIPATGPITKENFTNGYS